MTRQGNGYIIKTDGHDTYYTKSPVSDRSDVGRLLKLIKIFLNISLLSNFSYNSQDKEADVTRLFSNAVTKSNFKLGSTRRREVSVSPAYENTQIPIKIIKF